MSEQTRFLLNQSDLPKSWYNIAADSPLAPTPVLHPVTLAIPNGTNHAGNCHRRLYRYSGRST